MMFHPQSRLGRTASPLGPGALLPALVLAAVALAAPSVSSAASCGDDVGGERVACACGDIVVSDTILLPTDPVTAEPCRGDGLILQAPAGSDGITLHLGGQSLVGTGSGAGIRVTRGGTLGSVIIGGDAEDTRAEISNFDTGIRATGRNALREVRSLDVHANVDDGLKLRTSGVRVTDVRARGNGRDGAQIAGHGNVVTGVVAQDNKRDGLQVRGAGTVVKAETHGNERNGAAVGGRGNVVADLQSTDNGRAGVLATGSDHKVGQLQSAGNMGGDLVGRPGAVR